MEYIEKDATVRALVTDYAYAAADMVKKMPAADVVPVVRCRECKHYREHRTKTYGNLICRCTRMGRYDMDYPVRPDDFCSYGVKKSGH